MLSNMSKHGSFSSKTDSPVASDVLRPIQVNQDSGRTHELYLRKQNVSRIQRLWPTFGAAWSKYALDEQNRRLGESHHLADGSKPTRSPPKSDVLFAKADTAVQDDDLDGCGTDRSDPAALEEDEDPGGCLCDNCESNPSTFVPVEFLNCDSLTPRYIRPPTAADEDKPNVAIDEELQNRAPFRKAHRWSTVDASADSLDEHDSSDRTDYDADHESSLGDADTSLSGDHLSSCGSPRITNDLANVLADSIVLSTESHKSDTSHDDSESDAVATVVQVSRSAFRPVSPRLDCSISIQPSTNEIVTDMVSGSRGSAHREEEPSIDELQGSISSSSRSVSLFRGIRFDDERPIAGSAQFDAVGDSSYRISLSPSKSSARVPLSTVRCASAFPESVHGVFSPLSMGSTCEAAASSCFKFQSLCDIGEPLGEGESRSVALSSTNGETLRSMPSACYKRESLCDASGSRGSAHREEEPSIDESQGSISSSSRSVSLFGGIRFEDERPIAGSAPFDAAGDSSYRISLPPSKSSARVPLSTVRCSSAFPESVHGVFSPLSTGSTSEAAASSCFKFQSLCDRGEPLGEGEIRSVALSSTNGETLRSVRNPPSACFERESLCDSDETLGDGENRSVTLSPANGETLHSVGKPAMGTYPEATSRASDEDPAFRLDLSDDSSTNVLEFHWRTPINASNTTSNISILCDTDDESPEKPALPRVGGRTNIPVPKRSARLLHESESSGDLTDSSVGSRSEVAALTESPCEIQSVSTSPVTLRGAGYESPVGRAKLFPDSVSDGFDDSLVEISDIADSNPSDLHDLGIERPPKKLLVTKAGVFGASPSTNKTGNFKTMELSGSVFRRQREDLALTLFQRYNSVVFSNRLSSVSLVWTAKLQTTAGVTRLKQVGKSGSLVRTASIDLSSKVLDSEDRLRATLLHEMCHAASFLIDGIARPAHGACFKKWARSAMRAFPDVKVSTQHDYIISYKHAWICTNTVSCGEIYRRHSPSIDVTKHICSRCKSSLKEVDAKSVHGKKHVRSESGVENPDLAYKTKTKVPPSAYNLFVREISGAVRTRLRAEANPGSTVSQSNVLKECARLWREKTRPMDTH
jgi:predicted SprT family Zn-dependent metalloprotease